MTFVIQTPPSANTQKKRTVFWLDMQELFRRVHNEEILVYPPANKSAFQSWFYDHWYNPVCTQAATEYQLYIAGKPDAFVENFNTAVYPTMQTFPDSKYGTMKADIRSVLRKTRVEISP